MRVSKKVLALAGVGAMVWAAMQASAHHSFAVFDNLKSITLVGTVKEFQWGNPHCWLQLLVKDPGSGEDVEWSIEASSPGALVRGGWKKTSLKPGDKAEVVIHPLRDGSTGGALVTVNVDGRPVGKDPEHPT